MRTAIEPHPSQRLLWAAILASFVSFLDGSIVTVALPAIERDLGGGIVLQQWVVDGYLLSLGALILVAGAVSDAFGRLRVLRIAIVAFAVTSLICAISPTAGILIAARILQGVAGALLVPGSLSLIIATFPGPAQAAAIGRWTAWTSVSFLLGPVLGGVIVDGVGWRWVFVLSTLPAIAALALLGSRTDAREPGERSRINVPSAALTALGLGGLVSALIEAPRLGPGNPFPLVAGIGGAAALAVFVLTDGRSDHSLVPRTLFRHGNFTAGNLATFFIYGAISLSGLLTVLFLQETAKLPATVAALVSLPTAIASIVLAGWFGRLAGRYGPRWFMAFGPMLGAAGLAIIATTPSVALTFWWALGGLLVFAVGLAATVAPLTAAVLGAVPAAESGIGSAVNNAVARVAGLISTACAGVLIGGVYDLGAFRRAVLTTAALLAVGGIVSLVGVRNPARVSGRRQSPEGTVRR